MPRKVDGGDAATAKVKDMTLRKCVKRVPRQGRYAHDREHGLHGVKRFGVVFVQPDALKLSRRAVVIGMRVGEQEVDRKGRDRPDHRHDGVTA